MAKPRDRFQRATHVAVRLAIALMATAAALLTMGYVQTSRAAHGRMLRSPAQAPRSEVAIVLGALVHRNGALSDTVADRVACALALFSAGRVDTVLVSGDHGRVGYDEVSAMGAVLMQKGVPSDRVFLDHAGFRTLDTMQRARRVFGVRDAAICTQRFHLPRSLYLARASGINAVGVIADRRRYRSELYNEARESIARAVAVLDLTFGREARVLGPPISLAGDGRATHELRLRR